VLSAHARAAGRSNLLMTHQAWMTPGLQQNQPWGFYTRLREEYLHPSKNREQDIDEKVAVAASLEKDG